jgi:hypothetical protein
VGCYVKLITRERVFITDLVYALKEFLRGHRAEKSKSEIADDIEAVRTLFG